MVGACGLGPDAGRARISRDQGKVCRMEPGHRGKSGYQLTVGSHWGHTLQGLGTFWAHWNAKRSRLWNIVYF